MKQTIKEKIAGSKDYKRGDEIIYKALTFYFVKHLEGDAVIISCDPKLNKRYEFAVTLDDICKHPGWDEPITFNQVKDKTAKFSDFAFGKNRTALMPLAKLQEEIEELKECLEKGEEPDSEYADLLLILIDSFRKYYGDEVDMQYWLDACSEKLDINYKRDWKFHKEDKVFRYVK